MACADFPNVIAAGRCCAHATSDAMFRRPTWLCLHFCIMHCDSAKRHIFRVAHPGRGYDPKFELPQNFCTMHLPQVSSSCVYSFGSYRVNTQTQPQTNICRWKHLTFFAMLWRWINIFGSLTSAILLPGFQNLVPALTSRTQYCDYVLLIMTYVYCHNWLCKWCNNLEVPEVVQLSSYMAYFSNFKIPCFITQLVYSNLSICKYSGEKLRDSHRKVETS